MKITLYVENFTPWVFTDCDVTKWPDSFLTALQFTGTDEHGRKRHMTTNLPFTVEKVEPLDLAKETAKELRESLRQ